MTNRYAARDDEFPIIGLYLAVLDKLQSEPDQKKVVLLRQRAKQLRGRMEIGVERRALKAAAERHTQRQQREQSDGM